MKMCVERVQGRAEDTHSSLAANIQKYFVENRIEFEVCKSFI